MFALKKFIFCGVSCIFGSISDFQIRNAQPESGSKDVLRKRKRKFNETCQEDMGADLRASARMILNNKIAIVLDYNRMSIKNIYVFILVRLLDKK